MKKYKRNYKENLKYELFLIYFFKNFNFKAQMDRTPEWAPTNSNEIR